ncbi:MAG: hypothetical protein FWK04_29630 [Nostoc sp. GBBB01]|nr:hypothetical protein [Nostoc sp. GBBB01]
MLDKNSNHNSSPFQFPGLVIPQQQKSKQSYTSPTLPENNRERTFRRVGNICEIAAGASLNSAVIFTFHLLQVHPVGMLLALGVSHFYLTATAAGEEGRRITNIMSGASASLALLCSLSEPIGEWWEAYTSKSIASSEIEQIYAPVPADYFSWINGVRGVLVLMVLALILFNCNGKKRP